MWTHCQIIGTAIEAVPSMGSATDCNGCSRIDSATIASNAEVDGEGVCRRFFFASVARACKTKVKMQLEILLQDMDNKSSTRDFHHTHS
jgi:hypothetical protein